MDIRFANCLGWGILRLKLKQVPGLYFQLQPSGKKSWAVRYRYNGRGCKLTLGPFPAIDLKTARRKALEAKAKLADGTDPRTEKKGRVAAADDLIESVCAKFFAQHLDRNLRPVSAKEAKRILTREVVTPWRGRRLAEITRRGARLLTCVGMSLISRQVHGRFHRAGRKMAASTGYRSLPPPPIFCAASREITGSPFVFTVSGRAPIEGYYNVKKLLPGNEWSYHDLRRTFASGLAELGVQLPVIEKLLNHSSGTFAGIVGVYQRHSFSKEMRAATELWASHIERLTGGNVVELSA